ncbi:hypothetical protein B8130_18505 [Salmonella enterica]|nr:hypothetical protein [Salmonella enterica]
MTTITNERVKGLAESLTNCLYADPREIQELARIALTALTAQEAFESWFIKVHLSGIRQSQLKAAECKLVHRVAQSAWNGCCSAILEGDGK